MLKQNKVKCPHCKEFHVAGTKYCTKIGKRIYTIKEKCFLFSSLFVCVLVIFFIIIQIIKLNSIDTKQLLNLTKEKKLANQINIEKFSNHKSATRTDDPMWPVLNYLIAETLFAGNNTSNALNYYRKVVIWAATDPYNDKQGGSALSIFALWRCLKIIEKQNNYDIDMIFDLINAYEKIESTKILNGIYTINDFISLPQLQEEILRIAGKLTWKAGLEEKSKSFFQKYFDVARNYTEDEKKIIDMLFIQNDLITNEEIFFKQAKKLSQLNNTIKAKELYELIANSEGYSDIKAKALIELANLTRITNKTEDRYKVVELLDKVIEGDYKETLKQRALNLRIITLFREGRDRDLQSAINNIKTMIRKYPKCKYTDDALFYLGNYYQYNGNNDSALEHYKNFQKHKVKKNSWYIYSSELQSALIYYSIGDTKSLKESISILNKLSSRYERKKFKYLNYYLSSLFWLARSYNKLGKKDKAYMLLNKIISISPYHYYAVRSRMHLNADRNASSMILPDSTTRKQLEKNFKKSNIDTKLNLSSSYSKRIKTVIDNGLYKMSFSGPKILQNIFPSKRLQNISLDDIDSSGLIGYVALIISFQQDVKRANVLDKVKNSRLQYAGFVGENTGDWSTSLNLTGFSPSVQKDKRFLATAYPYIFIDEINTAAKKYNVRSELLYSIMRQESLFCSTAMSPNGAIGLFQFMPSTFEILLKENDNLSLKGAHSIEAFLFDPKLSIDLGGFWFGIKLKGNQNDNLLFCIIEHHAGFEAVESWKKYWKYSGQINDIEYMVESIRFKSTKNFVRLILRDMAIVNIISR